jgi:hypothetical protein
VFEGDGTSLFEGIRLACIPAAFRVFHVCGRTGRSFCLAELGGVECVHLTGVGSSGGHL